MKARVFIEGDKALRDVMKQFQHKNVAELDKSLANMALSAHGDAVKSIQNGARSGAVYKRRSTTHQASAAGVAPKTDTGDLVRSITVKRERKLDYTVGSRRGAPHGLWLEFGTRKMAKRPWLMPAFMRVIQKYSRALR